MKRKMLCQIVVGTKLILVLCVLAVHMFAQQKGQWVPGQGGLNAGVMPDPGVTYANFTLNYSADSLRNSSGSGVPGIAGTYSFWVIENAFFYIPKPKILAGHFQFMAMLPTANGSLTADLGNPPRFPISGGGYGYADTWVQPLTLGWHLSRVDTYVAYAFTAPTGRYSPGASDNVGSGYWGNNITSGTTAYLTKNKGTSLNLTTEWEIHGSKKVASIPAGQTSHITPGQAFTIEWGLGQVLPLKKDFSQLLQLGVIGYDQWQVSNNGGNYLVAGRPVRASVIPYYSVHAVGLQANYILPKKALAFFFKYEPEYLAKARPQGRTFVFGTSWTLRYPGAPKQ